MQTARSPVDRNLNAGMRLYIWLLSPISCIFHSSYIDMAMLQEYDAGKSGQPFYHTSMMPDDWYKWFDPENHDSDEGWTEVRQSILHYLWSRVKLLTASDGNVEKI